MLLRDFFEQQYRPIRLLGGSSRTLTLYRYSVRIFGETLGRDAAVDDLTDLAIANHLQRLLDSGHSPGSAGKERSQLVALWNFAAKRRMLDTWPAIAPIRKPETIPVAWTEEQLWRIRISCNFAAGDYHGVPANRWWLALHVLLYSTGERITAVRLLRWSDLQGNVLVIPAQNRKGRTRAIVKHLGADCMGVLEQIRSAWDGFQRWYVVRVPYFRQTNTGRSRPRFSQTRDWTVSTVSPTCSQFTALPSGRC